MEKLRAPLASNPFAWSTVAAGLLLHTYTAIFQAVGGFDAFVLGLMLLSWLPYLACALLLMRSGKRTAVTGGALATLVHDLYIYYGVFVSPQSSTDAVRLVVAPILNLFLITPAAAVVTELVHRLATSRLRG